VIVLYEGAGTDVATLPRNGVHPLSLVRGESVSFTYPRRAQEQRLPPNGVHLLILHSSQRPRGKPWADDQSHRRLGRSLEAREYRAVCEQRVNYLSRAAEGTRSTLRKLGYVLNGASDERASGSEKPRTEPV
jgi:hypothetical protein